MKRQPLEKLASSVTSAGRAGWLMATLFAFLIACGYQSRFWVGSAVLQGREPTIEGTSVHAFRVHAEGLDPRYEWRVQPGIEVWLGSPSDTGCVVADTGDTADPTSPYPRVQFQDWTVLMPCDNAWFNHAVDCAPGVSSCEAWLVFELVADRKLADEWSWEVQGTAGTNVDGCRQPPQVPSVTVEEVDVADVPAHQVRHMTLRAWRGWIPRRLPTGAAR